ncbi:MAG: SdpI family protein, partial [Cellulosilyticaceae bacterium]
MKKNHNPLLLVCVVLSLISLVATFFVLPNLPAQIPIHWNAAGEIDSYGSRNYALLTGALPLFMLLLLVVIPKIDPKKASYEKHAKAYHLVTLLITIFMMLIHWVTVLVSIGYNLSVGMIVPVAVGVLFIIIGNYMPQIRPNYTFGIRIPWALNNEDNWRATHRFGGYAFALAGVFMILDGLFSHVIIGYLSTAGIFICIFAPMIYSYIYYRNHEG